jgi:hypothetical protein
MRRIPIASARLIEPGETVDLDGAPGTIALDGEREHELLQAGHRVQVRLNSDGPRVVNVERAIASAAAAGVMAALASQAAAPAS